ncbi:hypothetical protein JCM6882_005464 [Rhodosporidiobolus microsporus]
MSNLHAKRIVSRADRWAYTKSTRALTSPQPYDGQALKQALQSGTVKAVGGSHEREAERMRKKLRTRPVGNSPSPSATPPLASCAAPKRLPLANKRTNTSGKAGAVQDEASRKEHGVEETASILAAADNISLDTADPTHTPPASSSKRGRELDQEGGVETRKTASKKKAKILITVVITPARRGKLTKVDTHSSTFPAPLAEPPLSLTPADTTAPSTPTFSPPLSPSIPATPPSPLPLTLLEDVKPDLVLEEKPFILSKPTYTPCSASPSCVADLPFFPFFFWKAMRPEETVKMEEEEEKVHESALELLLDEKVNVEGN